MKHILLTEDDGDYASILQQYLEISGFKVTWAKDGKEALNILKDLSPDICILDVMMPEMDGFTLAENIISKNPGIPFLFLTAKGLKEDKIRGLKLGADDYVVKPFEVNELILRIRNIIKRSQKATATVDLEEKILIGSYSYDPKNYVISHKDDRYRITEKEALLLQFLYQHKNTLIRREDILKEVWGADDFFSGRSMDVFISRLRKYFSNDPTISITSIRGIGLEFNIKN
ncbi:response regulator transcription factor [Myroides ceti]|uniref:Response regulator transcription factor n=1 Tax=Paenimyroides ceti TaxID=395087 RepID=A0ABT8D0U0_9FLAO|nr:response regulator transcription factor [Paenimyroides ceti]MDN3707835.1 response regulator transcription factor [Paenimyroides ceti]MDN3709478.1 response regulator transcription factor [Paenimyroides ceti]